jgi:predicted permease
MEAAFTDRLDRTEAHGRVPVLSLLARTTVDLLASSAKEWFDPTHPTPPPGASFVETLRQDLSFAVRSLVRRPGFTLVAVLTLALGIGANAAIFSAVDAVLLRPLPYPEPDGLVMVWAHDGDTPDGQGWMSRPDVDDIRGLESVESITGYGTTSITLTGGDRPEVVSGGRTTGALLRTFGLSPVLGRDLGPGDVGPDAPREAVIGHDFWMERYGGRRDVVGSTLEISERSYEIVGVAPAGFDFPSGARVWVGDRNSGSEGCGRGCHTLRAVARLAGTDTSDRAQDELDALATSLAEAYPDSNFDKWFRTEGLADYVVGGVRSGLWILLGAVALVLLIACANVANLLLVRASARRNEVAVRAALGAGRGRLVRQVLTESLLLALLGSAAGLMLARFGLAGLKGLAAGTVPRIEGAGVDATVLGFTAVVAVLVALLFGLGPALKVAGSPVVEGLGGGGVRGASRREGRSRSVLLAVEVGLSLVLLVGAGLLLRSFQELYAVDLGYDTREVVRFQVVLPEARYGDLGTVAAFYRTMEERLAAVPGVESVGSAFGSPLGNGQATGQVIVDGRPEPPPGQELHASLDAVTPGYLRTLRIPLLRGRPVQATDVAGTPPVAVVNEAFVRHVFPDEDPLGKRVHVTVGFGLDEYEGDNQPMWEIVGVVSDARSRGPRADPVPEIFVPQAQYGPDFLDVHVRGAPGATGLVTAARDVLASLDPNVPMRRVETLDEAVAEQAAATRFYLTLVALFAGLAVVLAAVGLYGVVAYLVSRRTREIGIRMALGARSREIGRLVVAQGLRPAGWGAAAGLVVALVGGRLVESVLFGVEPTDPGVLVGVTVLLLVIVVAASLIPARRAARVDPSNALREV